MSVKNLDGHLPTARFLGLVKSTQSIAGIRFSMGRLSSMAKKKKVTYFNLSKRHRQKTPTTSFRLTKIMSHLSKAPKPSNSHQERRIRLTFSSQRILKP